MATFPLRFPNIVPGFSTFRRPIFSSIVQQSASGREVRTTQQFYPNWEFELTFEVLHDRGQNQDPNFRSGALYAELQEISQLFLNCRGQWGTFLFADPSDRSREKTQIAIGDGTTTTFTVPRDWGFGDLKFYEPVGSVDLLETVYLNGVPLLPANYTYSGNQLTFITALAAGIVVTADFEFSYMCRFMEDQHEYEQFMRGLWKFQKCRFRTVKQPDLPVGSLTDETDAILIPG